MLLSALAHFIHQVGACSLPVVVGTCPIHPWAPPCPPALRVSGSTCALQCENPQKGEEKEQPLKNNSRKPHLAPVRAQPGGVWVQLGMRACSVQCSVQCLAFHAVSGCAGSVQHSMQCPAFHAVSGCAQSPCTALWQQPGTGTAAPAASAAPHCMDLVGVQKEPWLQWGWDDPCSGGFAADPHPQPHGGGSEQQLCSIRAPVLLPCIP